MASKHNNLQHYIFGTGKLGAGIGTISILIYWVSGRMLVSTPESILKLGVFGGFGYGLSGVIALIFFARVGISVRKHYPNENTLGDIIATKLNPLGTNILIFILCVIGLFTLILEAITASFLLQLINIPIFNGLLILISICIIYAGLGGIRWIQRLALVQIFFVFAAVILLPLFFFLQGGIPEVYSGIKLYHPYLLYSSNDYFLYIIIGLLIGMGVVITDLATWQRLYMIQSEKVFSTFILSSLIFLTIPLAFSSFFMVVLSNGGFQNMDSLWSSLKEILYQSPFLLTVFLFCSFSAITSTFGASLHAIVSLFLKTIIKTPAANESTFFRLRTILSIFIGLIILIATLFFHSHNFEFIFLGGNLFASLLFPMLVILYSKRKVSNFIPLSIIIATLIGFLSIAFVGPYHSVWFSALVSISLIFGYYLISSILTTLRHN